MLVSYQYHGFGGRISPLSRSPGYELKALFDAKKVQVLYDTGIEIFPLNNRRIWYTTKTAARSSGGSEYGHLSHGYIGSISSISRGEK